MLSKFGFFLSAVLSLSAVDVFAQLPNNLEPSFVAGFLKAIDQDTQEKCDAFTFTNEFGDFVGNVCGFKPTADSTAELICVGASVKHDLVCSDTNVNAIFVGGGQIVPKSEADATFVNPVDVVPALGCPACYVYNNQVITNGDGGSFCVTTGSGSTAVCVTAVDQCEPSSVDVCYDKQSTTTTTTGHTSTTSGSVIGSTSSGILSFVATLGVVAVSLNDRLL